MIVNDVEWWTDNQVTRLQESMANNPLVPTVFRQFVLKFGYLTTSHLVGTFECTLTGCIECNQSCPNRRCDECQDIIDDAIEHDLKFIKERYGTL